MKRFFLIGLIVSLLPLKEAYAAFSFYRSITVDHTKVPNTDQANFPVGVSNAAYTFLETAVNGGKVQNGSGFDVGFYTNSDCATGKMAWEKEKYTATTGDVAYWVSVSNLSHTSDTVFYMCYDDATISTDQSAATTVWSNASFVAVYHLGNGSSLSGNDSTSNANNGTINSATATTGQVDGGAAVTGGSNVYRATVSPTLNGQGKATMSIWMKPTTTTGVPAPFTMPNALSTQALGLLVISATSFRYDAVSAGTNVTVSSLTGAWHFVAVTYDSSVTSKKGYLDNTLVQTETKSGNISTSTDELNIGRFSSQPFNPFDGSLDEARLSYDTKSGDWLLTEYNNDLLPDKSGGASGFYTLGTETAVSAGATATTETLPLMGI